ncbi:hypothetical protein KAW64_09650 [bacterium]|nr:hypothetical protein [bacterium]
MTRALVLVTAMAVAMAGCSVSRPIGEDIEQLPPELVCIVVEGQAARFWSEARDGWWQEGGSMLLVGRSEEELGSAGALAAACRDAAPSILDLLAKRGVSYSDERRREIEEELTQSLASAGAATFPRVGINRDIIEHCTREPGSTGHWRSRVLIEYPIAYLRGDVSNVEWERDKLAREGATLVKSAEGFFDEGLWLRGQSELSRAALAYESMGLPESGVHRGVVMQRSVDRITESTARGLMIEPDVATTPLIIRAGEITEIRFRLTFLWNGVRVPAIGVQVAFEDPEWGVIVRAQRVSGPEGTASVIIQAVEKRGGGEMRAHIDRTALKTTPGHHLTHFIADDSCRATVRVQVIPERGVSVCLDMDGEDIAAARQLTDAFDRALGQYGCTLEQCGPGTDIIVRGDLSRGVVTSSDGGEQILAVLSAEAFDQRSALAIAKTTVRVELPPREDREESEALAFREVGRLLAVYLESRILPD